MRIRRRHSFFKSFLLSLLLEVQKLIHKLDLTIVNLLWLSTGALSRLILSDDSLRMAVNEFRTSKATGKILASELPKNGNKKCTVLYPASAKASNEIEEGLSNRGFEVVGLNTYTTEPVYHVDQTVLMQALSFPVVAAASPSAVRSSWVNLISDTEQWSNSVACIGRRAVTDNEQNAARLKQLSK